MDTLTVSVHTLQCVHLKASVQGGRQQTLTRKAANERVLRGFFGVGFPRKLGMGLRQEPFEPLGAYHHLSAGAQSSLSAQTQSDTQ
jgi:hypothetical protein